MTWDETGMQVELKVTFVVHPFKIANEPTTYSMTAGTHTITNLGMVVAPYVLSDAVAAIQIGTYATPSQTVSTGSGTYSWTLPSTASASSLPPYLAVFVWKRVS